MILVEVTGIEPVSETPFREQLLPYQADSPALAAQGHHNRFFRPVETCHSQIKHTICCQQRQAYLYRIFAHSSAAAVVSAASTIPHTTAPLATTSIADTINTVVIMGTIASFNLGIIAKI